MNQRFLSEGLMQMVGYTVLAAAVILLGVCLARALRAEKLPSARPAQAEPLAGAAEKLSRAIRIRTVSYDRDEAIDYAEFMAFHTFLQEAFPLVHQTMRREVVDTYSLLYRWEGTDPALDPGLLLAHMDVVPVNPETEQAWTHPPFEGTIADGYIWGRGALDMKGQLIALLEACERLIESGFRPRRDLYIAFGYNEERVYSSGAETTAKLLSDRGVRLHYVLDEGGTIMHGGELNVDGIFACVGVCEKGYADIGLRVKSEGGHAAMPPKHTALGSLAAAVAKLERRPMRYKILGASKAFLNGATPYMRFPYRFVFSNLWLFGGVVKRIMARSPRAAALLHTTLAATMAKASMLSNVLPQQAEAVVNVRMASWERVRDVLTHIRSVVGEEVELDVLYANEPSAVTDVRGDAFALVAGCIRRVFPEMIVLPYPMVGATDSRFYTLVCDHVLRFVPFRSLQYDLGGMHGTNERLAVESLSDGVRFFMDLMTHS